MASTARPRSPAPAAAQPTGDAALAVARLAALTAVPDLVDRVHRALLDAIADGRLQPGARITQDELADQFQVSRQPVLQALRLLKRDGFVVDAPAVSTGRSRGQGLIVTPLDPSALRQMYEVRGALDVLAARLACQSRVARPDFARLIAKGRAAVAGDDITAMIDADWAFHRAIYEASGNALIQRTAELHWCHIRRAMGAVLQEHRLRASVWDEHAAIGEAITAADLPRAQLLMQHHTDNASTYTVARLLARRSQDPHPNLASRSHA
jgi:DNA-binding GntR family transcriptional regulator